MDRNYSSPRMINNYTYQMVPNDGKHNFIFINLLSPKTIAWYYTSGGGKEQAKEIVDYLRNMFEKGDKVII